VPCRGADNKRGWGLDAAVVAAWIAAGAAALSAAVTAYFVASSGRRQQENELVVSALTHFVGRSQERSAGLAALRVLSGGAGSFPRDASMAQPPPGSWVRVFARLWFAARASRSRARWSRYAPAVGQLFYRQLIYVLCHGRNRWEAHEIANVVAMADWLVNDEMLAFNDPQQRKQLDTAMCTYLSDWGAEVKKPKEENLKDPDENSLPPHAHYESVKFVTKKINNEWRKRLTESPNGLSG
jgi:hypothetical protein